MHNQSMKKFSVLVLGPLGAGKTSLLRNLKGLDEVGSPSGTQGLDHVFCEDSTRTVKAVFVDPSGDTRFSFVRMAALQQKKDCIVIVVDNLNFEKSLMAIEACLCEIDQVYRDNHPPLGLIVNQKSESHINSEIFYATIEKKYADRFVFIDHCSVLDKNYRRCLFNQLARISGVPIIHEDPNAPDWSAWASDLGKSVSESAYHAANYIGSFFQRAPVVQNASDETKTMELPKAIQ